MSKLPQPDQPLYWHVPEDEGEERGTHLRFQPNAIVRDLLVYSAKRGFGHNEIIQGLEERGTYNQEDYEQFIQLIGYSFNGACELTTFREATLKRAMDAFVALGGDPVNPPKKEEHGT